MKPVRIAILHRSVVPGDAIGNDIMGSYSLLERMGFVPEIVCEFIHESISTTYRVKADLWPNRIRDAYDLMIYHHSIGWPDGEKIINTFFGSVVIKYHSITPAEYFSDYSQLYEKVCRLGREQTSRFVHAANVRLWQSDSSYNAQELADAGLNPSKNLIVPPFNRTGDLMRSCHHAVYRPGQRIDLLFVGRRAPNKGHCHLLRMLSSYIKLFSENVKLCIVGPVDCQLACYSEDLMVIMKQLGIADHVEWLSGISDQEIDSLFQTSHVYVNASEHEGFCVPIIEAQSMGLPVVTVDTTALRDTIGANQIVCPLPCCDEDYDLMAGLVHEVVANSTLRQQLIRYGFKNVYDRFSRETIENLFIGSLENILRELS